MKKIIYLFLPLFFFFVFSGTTYSQNTLYKHPNNPLLFSDELTNWNEIGKFQPSVHFDGNIFHMWYSSIKTDDIQIAYATSEDGINWKRKSILNLVEDSINHDPSVLIKDNNVTLFFTSSNNGSNFKISKVDFSSFTSTDNLPIKTVLTPVDVWESVAISSPFIYFENNIYYLFYSGASNGWNIGLATSMDGENWTRCSNNPILYGLDGPAIVKKGDKYYLYAHKVDGGIVKMETENTLSCFSNWSLAEEVLYKGNEEYDQNHLIAPSPLLIADNFLLYYSGLNNYGEWTINLASSTAIDVTLTPSPMPTLIPSFTPSPTITPIINPSLSPTPTQIPKKSMLIIIPGLLASWNKEAIIHNKKVAFSDWKIPSFIEEYSGIEKTLISLGYKKNKDFYIFPYDWRKNIIDSARDLDSFINEKIGNNPSIKVKIIGHSLGGLVGRLYSQQHSEKVSKLITIGSPHNGVVQAYKLVEAGEFDREDSLLWIAQKIILNINKKNFETDKQIISSLMPVSKDLLPTFNFLVNQDNKTIDNSTLINKNTVLNLWNHKLPSLYEILHVFAGKNETTLSGYKIVPPSILDRLLEIYVDGRPESNFYSDGDKTVLLKSAKAGNNLTLLSGDHRDLVVKKAFIKKILEAVDINVPENKIIEGNKTNIQNALIFIIKSPATMKVTINEKLYPEEEGIIFIKNAPSGMYKINVLGFEKGVYNVLVGEFTNTDYRWQNIEGIINSTNPNKQIDQYTLIYNKDKIDGNLIRNNDIVKEFNVLINKLKKIRVVLNKPYLNGALTHVNSAKINYTKKQYQLTRRSLLNSHSSLFKTYSKKNAVVKSSILDCISDLENLYASINENDNSASIYVTELKINIFKALVEYYKIKIGSIKDGDRAKEISFLIKITEEKNSNASFYLKKNKLYSEVLLHSVKELVKLIHSSLKAN